MLLSLFLFLALFVWRTSNRTHVYKYTCTLHAFVYTRGGLHVPPVHMHKAIRAHSPVSVRFIGARFSHLSVSLFLSHPYPSVLARPVSFLQARSLAPSPPLFYLSLGIALACTRRRRTPAQLLCSSDFPSPSFGRDRIEALLVAAMV